MTVKIEDYFPRATFQKTGLSADQCALLDAELLAQLYIELTGGRQIGLGLAQEEAKDTIRAELAENAAVRPIRPARVFQASAEELERHAAFIATLDKPLWLDEAEAA